MFVGLLCDLLWSDPDKDVQGWGENDRGVSFTFGADVVSKFLNRHDLDLICRAHQVVEDGYEFFAKRQLVTLFSAPNYCGEFDNAGGMMSVDETLMCSFQVRHVLNYEEIIALPTSESCYKLRVYGFIKNSTMPFLFIVKCYNLFIGNISIAEKSNCVMSTFNDDF